MSTGLPSEFFLYDSKRQLLVPYRVDYGTSMPYASDSLNIPLENTRSKSLVPDKRLGVIVPIVGASPNSSTFPQLASIAQGHPFVDTLAIVSPTQDERGTSTGSGPDPKFAEQLRLLRRAGITPLGYVDTHNAVKPINDVSREIGRWKTWYPEVDGIFFANIILRDDYLKMEDVEYYNSLDKHAK